MSRSRRHTKIFGGSNAPTEKQHKASMNRAHRVGERVRLQAEGEDHTPTTRSTEYGPKDGKTYWRGASARDMRK
jgi:hypothetical protein